MSDQDPDALEGKELDELQSQIDDLKSRVEHHAPDEEDEGEGDEGHFVDEGNVREEEVDDTIAPPG